MREKLQPLLLPEVLQDTELQPNNKNAKILADVINIILPYVKLYERRVEIHIPPEIKMRDPHRYNGLIQFCEYDPAMPILFKLYPNYLIKKNNYVFTKGLTEALKNTSADVKCSIIPKEFCGYITMPNLFDNDGDKIIGCFIYLTNNEMYGLAFTDGLNAMPHFHFLLKDTQMLSEVVKQYDYVELSPKGKFKSEGALFDFQTTLINGLIYIASTDADISYKVNNFSTKKKKYETQKKIFSSNPFHSVGENFTLVRKEMRNDISVVSHWRWQRHGKGLNLHKLIFIKEHMRNTTN